MDVLSMMKNRRNSPLPKTKEIVKSFGKFTIDLNNHIKEKKIIKTEREYAEFIKLKIHDYIKNNFKEKGIKNDIKSFYNLLLFELYRIHTILIEEFDPNKTNFTEEIIFSIIKSNYDFEDQLFITSEEVHNKILNHKNEYSQIVYLLISVSYIKVCDLNDIIFEKDFDLSDISIKIVKTLLIYHKIFHISQNLSERNITLYNIVKNAINDILPHYIKFLNELLDDPDLKSVLILIDEDYLSIMYNVIGELKVVRNFLFDLYIKLNSIVKDGIKIRKIKRNIIDNKCLEGILSNLKKNYSYNNYENVIDIFSELLHLLHIAIAFYDLENVREVKLEVFNFFTKLFEDLYFTTENFEIFSKTSLKFIQDIFSLVFVDKEDLKIKLINKIEITNLISTNHLAFKDADVLEFLLDLFDFFNEAQSYENNYRFEISKEKIMERNEFIRKAIFRNLLDTDSSLIKYKFLITKTSFCQKVLENLSNFSEEMISYPLSSLLIIMSEQGGDKHYNPEKEFRSILKTLSNCENEEKMKIILKSFKSFLDMSTNNHKLMVQCGFFSNVFDILNKTLYNLESNQERCLSADVLLFLLNILDQVLSSNQQYIIYLKDYQVLENFFERFISHANYLNLAYKIWSVCMVNEIDSKEVIKHSKFLCKRYNFLVEKLKNSLEKGNLILLINEFYRIYEIIQIVFLNDNFMKISSTNFEISSNNILKGILLDFPSLLGYLKNGITKIDKTENSKVIEENNTDISHSNFYGFLKNFFKILNIIVINSNKYIFKERLKSIKFDSHNKIKRFEFLIKKKELKDVIINIITSFQDDNNSILEVLKILMEISLHFTDSVFILTDLSPRICVVDIYGFIKDKIKININEINDQSLVPNLSTIIIENPLIIKICLISLIKVCDFKLIKSFLDCIEYLMKININNIKILLSHNLIRYLLQLIELDKNNFYDKVLNIIEISSNFFSTNNVEEIFLFILYQINRNQINLTRLIDIINKNLYVSSKMKRSIVLSNYVTKQQNIFNLIYTGNIRFSYTKFKESYKKTTSFSIFLSFSYKNYDKIQKNESFILFRFEREEKNKDLISLEAVLENNLLFIRENEKDVFSSNDHLIYLKSGKNINFLFIINKDLNSIEIFINEKLLCIIPTELKYMDLNYTYNLITGFNGNSLKEISSDSYQTFPYINLSYFMIYADKITSEKMICFKLSQIFNSKNGSCKSQSINLKFLSKNKYKMFATNNEDQSDIIKSINLQIDTSRVIYELVYDRIKIYSNNYIQKHKNDTNILTNFLSKLQRRYSIDVIEKLYMTYIKNTNFSADNDHFLHSYLFCKNNNIDLIISQNIFVFNNLKNQLLHYLYNDNCIDISVSNFRFTYYILTLLNDCNDEELFYKLMNLLVTFLLLNLNVMTNFCDSDEFKMFMIIIYKKIKIVKEQFIDIIFSLAFGLNDLEGISFFNPLFPKFISDFILDFYFFKIVGTNIQMYILKRIKSFFNPNEFFFIMYESNFQIKVDVLNKLYQFLLILEVDKKVNNELITLVIMILEQTLKIKKGENEPSDTQLECVTNFTQEFFLLSGYFDEISNSHLKYKKKDKDEITNIFVIKNFSKLYSPEIKMIREDILEHFTKIFEDLTNKKNQTIFNMKVQNFLNPAFFLKLYNKEIRQKVPRSKESLSKINMKIIQNISYNEEFTPSVDNNTNLSRFTKSPLIVGQRSSSKDVRFNFSTVTRSDTLVPNKKGSDSI